MKAKRFFYEEGKKKAKEIGFKYPKNTPKRGKHAISCDCFECKAQKDEENGKV